MKLSTWPSKDFNSNQLRLELQDKNEDYFLNKILEKYFKEMPPLSIIEIETVNCCPDFDTFLGLKRGSFQMIGGDVFDNSADESDGVHIK